MNRLLIKNLSNVLTPPLIPELRPLRSKRTSAAAWPGFLFPPGVPCPYPSMYTTLREPVFYELRIPGRFERPHYPKAAAHRALQYLLAQPILLMLLAAGMP
jgi:hypothetical protein